ncbi:MAG: hypothetical protein PHP22_04345 [Oscillospiraceae bacterium]|nr:hypothetical protein [Oscillospiraceae bacterium]
MNRCEVIAGYTIPALMILSFPLTITGIFPGFRGDFSFLRQSISITKVVFPIIRPGNASRSEPV